MFQLSGFYYNARSLKGLRRAFSAVQLILSLLATKKEAHKVEPSGLQKERKASINHPT